MMRSERAFLPAAGHDFLLPLYDPFTKLFGFDAARRALVAQAQLEPHHRVLDVGCGTGTLAVLIKQLYPNVEVIGLDPDVQALGRARQKADRAGVAVRFDMSFAGTLGYREASFDRVFSSLMFHHLETGQKEEALREARRVLRPGGRLELMDFAGPDAPGLGAVGRVMHSNRRLRDNAKGRVLYLMAAAGLDKAALVGEQKTLFGRLAYYQASAPLARD